MVAAAQPVPDTESDGVRAHALAALDEANGDWRQAAVLLAAWGREDEELYRALTATAYERQCWSAIRSAARAVRSDYWHSHGDGSVAVPVPDAPSGIIEVGRRALMDYPLSGGRRLGDATRTDLEAEAAMHDRFARSNAVRARWYRLIAAALKGDKPVGAVLSEAKLEALQRKAEEE